MSQLVQEQQLFFNNFLTLNFTYVEQRLKKNFEIIAGRLGKLQSLLSLEDRVKTLQRESKFSAMKIENMALRLPDAGSLLSPQEVKIICGQRVDQLVMKGVENIKHTKLFLDIKDALDRTVKEQPKKDPKKLLAEDYVRQAEPKKQSDASDGQNVPGTANSNQPAQQNAGSSAMRISKEILSKHLTKEQMVLVQRILKEDKPPEQLLIELAVRLDHLQRAFEETRISRGILDIAHRQFDKYETVDQKFSKYERDYDSRNKSRTSGVPLNVNTNITSLSTQQAQNNLKESRKLYTSRKVINTDELQNNNINNTNGPTQIASKPVLEQQESYTETIEKMTQPQPPTHQSKRNKSLTKLAILQKTDKKLRVDDPKDLNYILKQIESRLEVKVSKEAFMNFVQDFEERLESVKYSKAQNQAMEFKRYYNSLQNRLQAIIAFLQQHQEEDDPLVTKKKWACMSCDKPLANFNAKLGPHLNWDVLAGKKTSPTKAGSFGQTIMYANKVKSIIQNRKDEDP